MSKKKLETFIAENEDRKIVGSPLFNMVFDKHTGFTATWGRTQEEDPVMSPLGPVIADIEISTICTHSCLHCYKSNTGHGQNMSLETYKKVFSLLKPEKTNSPLTQVALGIGSLNANPDLWKIMEYTRENGVIPNITVSGKDVDEDTAQRLANICGAVSVSFYSREATLNAVDLLTKAGLKQTNLHVLLSEEGYDRCFDILEYIKNDKRLEKLNAVVFLMLKPKGNRNKLHNIQDLNKFFQLIKKYQEAEIQVGMDSCTAPLMLKFCELHDQMNVVQSVEPCESTLFSSYVSVNAEFFPCSFAEQTEGWETGINILEADNFLKDIWYHPRTKDWRDKLLTSSKNCKCSVSQYCRSCPIYENITPCKGKQ